MRVAQRDREIRRRLRVLEDAARVGSASRACRYFGVGRATFYRWGETLAKEGDAGLARKKPTPRRRQSYRDLAAGSSLVADGTRAPNASCRSSSRSSTFSIPTE